MEATSRSTIIETKLDQIPLGFRLLAKEELQKEITKHNSSLTLDTDTTYINMASGTSTSSETLTEALLKKSIGEINLLNNNLAGLYRNPTDVNVENQIQGLNTAGLKNIIDRLSITLVNTYTQQVEAFWESEEISIPEELQANPADNLLKALVENSSLIEKVYQVDNMYPNLKQTVVSYFSKKLKGLYKKDIHPDTVDVLLFNIGQENSHLSFLSFDLTSFTLNYFSTSLFNYSSDTTTLQAKVNTENIPLSNIFQESDILAIKSKHRVRLDNFFQKNVNNYRVLAKFSYLRAILEQQNGTFKLSNKGLELALQAMGFDQEKRNALINSNEIDPKELPLSFLETLSNPNHVEVSSFLFNNQTSSDILKIRDTKTNDLTIYIPGYTPSFIEAKDERLLNHWVFHQTEASLDNFSLIASHFPHSSRVANNAKLDAFLYQNYIKQGNAASKIAQGDIFSFITERQKARMIADLDLKGTLLSSQSASPNYQSSDSALFTTIAMAVEYVPYLLPNIHVTSGDLHELFPSPYTTASEFMKKAIKAKLNLDIDPDTTFIGYFLPRNKFFTEATKSEYSKTQSLTQAALSNYRLSFTPFSSTTIIFTDPSGKGEDSPSRDRYVNALPKDIEEIIKTANLDTLHKSKLDSFWSAHADRIKYFIKHRFLQQSLEAYHNKFLEEENFNIVSEVAFCALALEEEELHGLINPNICIEIISVDSYQSTDMFVFRDTSKPKVILYIAGNQRAFFSFANYENCICFLEENARKDTNWQKLLLPHFSIDSQDSVLSSLKLGPYTQSSTLGTSPYPRPVDCSFTNPDTQHPITTKSIEKSLFEVIQKNIQERSYADANAVIISDNELKLRRIILIAKSINMALLVPSLPFPILNWASLAALATETAVNLYIAKNGDTVKERYQAATSVGTTVVELLVIGAFLSFRSLKFSKNQSLSEVAFVEGQNARVRSVTGSVGGRGTQSFLKKTPIVEETFFDTTKPMQVWQIAASNNRFNHLDVKAWFLDEQFLLFTGKTGKAKHLIISSDGGYFPGSGIVKVPANSELVVLGPHGWSLPDPRTSNIAKKLVLPYGIINERAALPTQTAFHPSLFSRSSNTHIYPNITDVKLLAGTNVPGYIKNYSLAKYQKFGPGEESYLDIVHIINSSRHPFPSIYGIGSNPVDILTIRNRRGMFFPNLKDVFKSLQNHGIHYDRITLEFCRSNILLPKTKPAPRYTPARV